MKQYPMQFEAEAKSQAGISTHWTAIAIAYPESVRLAIPPEFDGPGNGFSPEDLYLMALQNCFLATFKVFAEKSRLLYSQVLVQARLEVDRNEKGQPWMARTHLNVSLKGVQQAENAKRILSKTSENCMILNSVKTEITFEFDIQHEYVENSVESVEK